MAAGEVKSEHLSLAGTAINCAGGVTPWGSWLSCEEAFLDSDKPHGYVFEVPASARGMVDPLPLKALGRFRHEAAAVDPRTGIVYLTEDRDDGLFYRLLPERKGRLAAGGRFQVLAFSERERGRDARNWGRSEEHTSELQTLMRISYDVFCLKKNKTQNINHK